MAVTEGEDSAVSHIYTFWKDERPLVKKRKAISLCKRHVEQAEHRVYRGICQFFNFPPLQSGSGRHAMNLERMEVFSCPLVALSQSLEDLMRKKK